MCCFVPSLNPHEFQVLLLAWRVCTCADCYVPFHIEIYFWSALMLVRTNIVDDVQTPEVILGHLVQTAVARLLIVEWVTSLH